MSPFALSPSSEISLGGLSDPGHTTNAPFNDPVSGPPINRWHTSSPPGGDGSRTAPELCRPISGTGRIWPPTVLRELEFHADIYT